MKDSLIIQLGTGNVPISDYPQRAVAVEYYVFHVAEGLARRGYNVWIIDIDDANRSLSGGIKLFKVRLPRFVTAERLSRIRSLAFSFAVPIYVRKLARGSKSAIVGNHGQLIGSVLLLSRRLGFWSGKIVHTTHDPYLFQGIIRRIIHFNETLVMRNSDLIIANSPTQAAQISRELHIPPSKIKQVFHGIDVRGTGVVGPVDSACQGLRVILYTARVNPRKNQLALVRAMPRIRDSVQNTLLVLTGPIEDSRYFREILRFIETHGISKNVRITGELTRDQVTSYYRIASVFVFPSKAEIGAQSLREALAFGLPVVASKQQPMIDLNLLQDGAMMLVDADSPRELADGVIRILKDDRLRASMRVNALKLANRLSWDYVTIELDKAYRTLLES